MPEWISVKDRLPEPQNDVLVYGPVVGVVTCYLAKVTYGYYANGIPMKHDAWIVSESEEGNYLDFESVTHWMELPEAPKEV